MQASRTGGIQALRGPGSRPFLHALTTASTPPGPRSRLRARTQPLVCENLCPVSPAECCRSWFERSVPRGRQPRLWVEYAARRKGCIDVWSAPAGCGVHRTRKSRQVSCGACVGSRDRIAGLCRRLLLWEMDVCDGCHAENTVHAMIDTTLHGFMRGTCHPLQAHLLPHAHSACPPYSTYPHCTREKHQHPRGISGMRRRLAIRAAAGDSTHSSTVSSRLFNDSLRPPSSPAETPFNSLKVRQLPPHCL